jgi:hypothetical protein
MPSAVVFCYIVKNLFGLFSLLWTASSVNYNSYLQVLTPVDNLQSLLRLPIFDKTRLVAFHKKVRQRNYTNWFLPDRENASAHGLDSLYAITKTIITKRLLQTDAAKLRWLTPLSESTSLSDLCSMQL